MNPAPPTPPLGLGLDAGGSSTRWALADARGQVLAEGFGPGLTALMLASADGRERLRIGLRMVAAQARAALPAGCPAWTMADAGWTGYDPAQAVALREGTAPLLAVAPEHLALASDIEHLCRAAFAPGTGIVLYAGTGAVAAHLPKGGELARAGGRGVVLDDAGGGHWIATRALRHLWRLEDAEPGSAAATPLGQALFARLEGRDWADTRAFVYGSATQYAADRGTMGRLAVQVAQAAWAGDEAALALLQAAGRELARLPLALRQRLGPQPLVTAGRVFELHPVIADTLHASLAQALPGGWPSTVLGTPPHHAAARRAAARTPVGDPA